MVFEVTSGCLLYTQFRVIVHCEVKKSYDTIWHEGIVNDLKSFGVSGNLPNTLARYMSHSPFRLKVDPLPFSLSVEEGGVPQSGIMNCTLLIRKMKYLGIALPGNISYSL